MKVCQDPSYLISIKRGADLASKPIHNFFNVLCGLQSAYKPCPNVRKPLIVKVHWVLRREYYTQTKAAINLGHLWIGLFHSFVFGILVALAGCLRGMQCGRSASAVGDAATSAVVTGIVSIIISTAVITVICNVLGI